MSNNLSAGPVQVLSPTVAEINLALLELQNRIDALIGLRGRVMHYDRVRADDPVEADDVVTLGSVNSLANQPFVTALASAALLAERVLTGEATVITITDNGANSTIVVSITANGVTDAKLRQGAATSVIGRSANSTGNVADIATTTNDHVLRRTANVLGFGTVDTGGLTNNAVTDAKLRDSAAVSVMGRGANSGGDPADIVASANEQVLGREGDAVAFSATTGANARVAVSKNSGATVGTRRRVNLIEGSAIALTVADDSGNEEVDVTVALSGSAQTYTPTNVTTDRSFDADTVAIAELADVVGTLIADLQARGILA